jgi:general secretion pathway protein A
VKRNWPAGLLLLMILSVPVWGAPALSQRQYYEKATLQYLVGDLSAAGKNLRILLKINPKYPGAKELLNSILREKSLKQIGLFPPVAAAPAPVAVQPTPEVASLTEAPAAETGLVINHEAFIIVFGTSGAALVLLFLILVWDRLPIARRRPVRRCFNCGAELSTSIDQCPNCGGWIGAKLQFSIAKAQFTWYGKFGWRRNPFTLDIHPELFTGFKEEVRQILAKISAESGHILIMAPLGAGKTTLLRWLSNQLIVDSFALYLPRPPQDFGQLIKLLVEKMGVPRQEAEGYDIYHLQELRKRVGKTMIILIDEAHEFTLEIEKPLRTLGDIDGVKLIMAGLPETVDKFKREIRPFYERLVLTMNLKPIDFATMQELIKTRIEHFGGEGTAPFTADALQTIFEISGGVPRRAIKACDWAVTRAIETGEIRIDAKLLDDLKKAAREAENITNEESSLG